MGEINEIKYKIVVNGFEEVEQKIERLLSLLKEAKSLYDEMASGEWELTFKLEF